MVSASRRTEAKRFRSELKIMNDAAIALADKECRSEFVSLCVRNIEEMVERVLAIPE